MLSTIGKTPIVRLKRIVPSDAAEVWVKIEGVNPTGSYKDRMALAMVEGAEADGILDKKLRLLECTGGSTGTSLAFVCSVKSYPLTIITSDAYAKEKIDSMYAFGAEVIVESSIDGQVTPDLWPRMRQRAADLVSSGSHYWLDQFNNPYGPVGYQALGAELVSQLPKIDVFCGIVGTAGMIVGTGQVLRDANPEIKIVALEPDTSPVLSGGKAGSHTIDGTAAGFISPLFDPNVVTDVMVLPESEARQMVRKLATEEGIFAGTSTGMNVLAALQIASKLSPKHVVATVACDTGFKYLSGNLYQSPST